MNNYNFSGIDIVFCDSKEATEWAYLNNLPKESIIYTSSPAMLWEGRSKVKDVQSFWDTYKYKKFQSSIKKFSEEIFDNVMLNADVDRNDALRVAKSSVFFHRILFKAACLSDRNLQGNILVIRVKDMYGTGSFNTPWECILNHYDKLTIVDYKINSSAKSCITTSGVPYRRRLFIGGIETFFYRVFIKLYTFIPSFFSNKVVLIPNENELIIETAFSLAIRGYRVENISPAKDQEMAYNEESFHKIKKSIYKIIISRIDEWVIPSLTESVKNMYFEELRNRLDSYATWYLSWNNLFSNDLNLKKRNILLINSPGTGGGLALTKVCSQLGIPVISFQHGVTKEICSTHSEVSAGYEVNSSNCFVAYNKNSTKAASLSHFAIGKTFVSGMSARHLRMKRFITKKRVKTPIVYVSTHLYKGNIGAFNTTITDFEKSKWERDILTEVFLKLPYQVRYKRYPEENIRYPDADPVLDVAIDNIKVFNEKIDMRFLMDQHQVIVTSEATSTLGWLILSGIPVVFINTNNEAPLTQEAFESLKKSVFLFNDSDKNFHYNLRNFLSKPINEIQELWEDKEADRRKTIKDFFSAYPCGAGNRIAKMISEEYF